MGQGDLSDAEWERLRPFLPVSNRRCGRWRNHRQVIDGILHRVRTGVQWRDPPERFGSWKTVYERHRLWSADGTWERLLRQVQAEADAAGEIDWDISVDSTIVRAHQHAAGARTDPPPSPGPKGEAAVEHQDETPWQSLVARLVEVVQEARDWPFAGRVHGQAPPECGRPLPPALPGPHTGTAGGLHTVHARAGRRFASPGPGRAGPARGPERYRSRGLRGWPARIGARSNASEYPSRTVRPAIVRSASDGRARQHMRDGRDCDRPDSISRAAGQGTSPVPAQGISTSRW
ncbi:IS5 family transposase [Streptomyces wedmorensis]|uniref:IS5 family transposase n=1 Tax=Streptomyces wedmorensis TaxID=43759 RepID=UPI003F4D2503